MTSKWLVGAIVALMVGCGGDGGGSAGGERPRTGDPTESPQINCEINGESDGVGETDILCTDTARDCPCGSFCDATTQRCVTECVEEGDCSEGLSCASQGECVAKDPEDAAQPPDRLPTMAVSPLAATLDEPVAGADFAVTEITVQVLASDEMPPPLFVRASEGLEVACGEQTTTFATSCDLRAGAPELWTRSADGEWTLSVAARPTTSSDAEGWTVEFLSQAVANDRVTTSLLRRLPQSRAGHYEGVLTMETADEELPPIRIPVTAVASETSADIVFNDQSHALSSAGAFLVDTAGGVRTAPWLEGAYVVTLQAEPAMQTHEPYAGSLSGRFHVGLPEGSTQLTWSYELSRIREASECPASCPSDEECLVDFGACVPTAALAAGRTAANNVTDERAAAYWARLQDYLGDLPAGPLTATLMCFEPEQVESLSNVGLGTSYLPTSGELRCRDGRMQRAVPLLSQADQRKTLGDLLSACVRELERDPADAAEPERLFQDSECISLARFYPALRLAAHDELGNGGVLPQDRRATLLYLRLMQQWLQAHSFVATQGALSREAADVLLSAASPGPAETDELGGTATASELLDLTEGGLRLLLDKTYQAPLRAIPPELQRAPDYRQIAGLGEHWPIGILGDTYGRIQSGVTSSVLEGMEPRDGRLEGGAVVLSRRAYLRGRVPRDVDLAHDLTVAFRIWPPYSGRFTTVVSNPNIGISYSADGTGAPHIKISHSGNAGVVPVRVPNRWRDVPSDWVIVRDTSTSTYRIYGRSRPDILDEVISVTRSYVNPPVPSDERELRVGELADIPNGTIGFRLHYLAIWPVALNRAEVEALNLELPLQPRGDVPGDPEHEQLVGIPAHLLETLAAHLTLQRRQLAEYGDTAVGCLPVSPTITAPVIARAGRSLQYAWAIEQLAEQLYGDATSGGATTWWDQRYQSAVSEVAALRSQLADELAAMVRCQSKPLLAEGEVALFFDDQMGEVAKFFSASRAFVPLAERSTQQAANALEGARTRWLQRRDAQLQERMTEADQERRMDLLEQQFTDEIRQLCGITEDPPGGIIQALEEGTLSPQSCFIDEQACQGSANASIAAIQPQCLRGLLGESIMAIKMSYDDATTAHNAAERAERQYEAASFHCAQLQEFHEETGEAIAAHNKAMKAMREQRKLASLTMSAFGVVAHGLARNPGGAIDSFLSIGQEALVGEMDRVMAKEAEQHQEYLIKRGQQADVMRCYHEADMYHFSISAAMDQVRSAATAVQQASLRFRNLQNRVEQLAVQASGALSREEERTIPTPAHHYWVDEEIQRYRRYRDWSRRLTYLAVRVTEYDFQTSLGLADEALTADHPDQLEAILSTLRSYQASPRVGSNPPQEQPVAALSVRDDILSFGDPKDPTTHQEASARLHYLLPSPQYAVRDENGRYLGQGIRFSLSPEAAELAEGKLVDRCAERLWGVSASVQMQPAPVDTSTVQVRLLQRNRFASTWCEQEDHESSLQHASVRPSRNLLLPAELESEQRFVEADAFTASDLNGPVNRTKAELQSDAYSVSSAEDLAGRGIYGDYILLFPKSLLDSGFDIGAVQDVYLRLDLLSVATPAGRL